jgi:hypothetical protein
MGSPVVVTATQVFEDVVDRVVPVGLAGLVDLLVGREPSMLV